MLNVELLTATMSRILAEPENWYQAEWITTDPVYLPEGNTCGTAMCFAGHAAVLDGALPMWRVSMTTVVDRKARLWSLSMYATQALGLTEDQAGDLFAVNNSLDDLQRKVKDLVEQAQQ